MATLDELPLSTSAYLADTQHLTLPQHGAYLLILMTMWRAGGRIDDDDNKLAVICKLTVAKWRKIAPAVRALLTEQGGKLTQKRLLFETETALKRVSKNRQNGSAGGKAKSLKNNNSGLATARDSLERTESPLSTTLFDSVDREGKVEGEPKPKPRGSHRLPPDWTPGDTGYHYAAQNGFDRPTAERMFEAFKLHHVGHGTKWEVWALAWQKWVRNEAEWKRPKQQMNGTPTMFDIASGRGT